MPRPSLPPTPKAWPEVAVKGPPLSSAHVMDASFTLPPSAMNEHSSGSHGHVRSRSQDTSSVAAEATLGSVSLPPPPTRSRKIIQVTPGSQQVKDEPEAAGAQASPAAKRGAGGGAGAGAKGQGNNSSSTATTTTNGSGRKRQNAGTSAGRKIARKTAHSLIERRRRSKMNEEFATLKDMIPACSGQDMHKLAILQASIDYLRYLEKCVAELKASRLQPGVSSSPASTSSAHGRARRPAARAQRGGSSSSSSSVKEEDEREASDEEMADLDRQPTPVAEEAIISRIPSLSSISSSDCFASPAVSTHSAACSWQPPRTGAGEVALPSPAFDAQHAQKHGRHNSSISPYHGATTTMTTTTTTMTPPWHSNNPSPMILPQAQQQDLDHEASAALLMLNASLPRRSLTAGHQHHHHHGGGGSTVGIVPVQRAGELPPSPALRPSSSAKNPKVRGLSVNDLLRS